MAYKSKRKFKRKPRRYVKKARRRFTKRNRRGNRRRRGPALVVPNQRFVTLRYMELVQPTLTAAVFNYISCHKSSLNQPNYGAGGHQPMWFDQMSLMFRFYRVFGIKYKYTIAATTSDETYRCVVKHQNAAAAELTTLDGYYAAVERGHAKTRDGGSRNGANGKCIISGYMNVAKTLGVTKSEVSSTASFRGETNNTTAQFSGTDPSLQAFLGLYIHSLNGIKLDIKTELIFFAKLYDLKEVIIS